MTIKANFSTFIKDNNLLSLFPWPWSPEQIDGVPLARYCDAT